jgi:hypothetical protein
LDLKESIVQRAGNKFQASVSPDNMYLLRHVNFSPALNRFLSAAYVKERVTIFDFDCLVLEDYIQLTKIDNSLMPYLRAYCKEYYEHTISYAIEKLNPNLDEDEEIVTIIKENECNPTNNQRLSDTEKRKKLDEALDRLEKGYGKLTTHHHATAIKRDTSVEFNVFMQNLLDAKLDRNAMLAFIERKTDGFQIDKLEIAFFHIVNYILTQTDFKFPDSKQIEKRKKDIIDKGNMPPTINCYIGGKKTYKSTYNVEQMFPELFVNYVPLRNILINQMQNVYDDIKPSVQKQEGSNSLSKSDQKIIIDEEFHDDLFKGLKIFFPDQHAALKDVLQGNVVDKKLVFLSSQNQLVEVFRRLKYNKRIHNSQKEIQEWLCSNFQYRYKKGKTKEIRNLNNNSVKDLLEKGKGEPSKKSRICISDKFPYLSPDSVKQNNND